MTVLLEANLEAFTFKLVSITWPCNLFLLITSTHFYRACCTLLCKCGNLIFAPMLQFSKLALARKLWFHHSCGNCKRHSNSIRGLSWHLWRVFTTYFVFLCEDHEKYNVIKPLILNKESKVGQWPFQGQKFIIKPHKEIAN